MLSQGTKTLLKNVIRHTDTHNRMLEEADMWRQRHSQFHSKNQDKHESRRTFNKERRHSGEGYSYLQDKRADMSREFGSSRKRKAHMDDEETPTKSTSTYWMRKLHQTEEADPDRWGHGGYKELYPDEFINTDSESDSSSQHDSPKRRSKKKKKRSKRKQHDSSSDSDLDSGADTNEQYERKKEKKRKKKKEKKEKKKKRKRKKSESKR